MKPSITKLRNYFRLEADKDYENKAIIGGIESMLEPWAAEARVDQIPEAIIQVVMVRLRDYQGLSQNSRKEVLGGIWKRIERELGAEPLDDDVQQRPQRKPQPQAAVKSEIKPSPEKVEPPPEKEDSPPQVRQEIEDQEPADLNANVTTLDKIGPGYAEKLKQLNIETLGDLLYHFPKRYVNYSELKPINKLVFEDTVTVIGTVKSIHKRAIKSGKNQLVEAILSDGTGALQITWFNQPWIINKIKANSQISISGKIDQYLGRLTVNNPEWSPLGRENLLAQGISPVYPLTAKITQNWLRQRMKALVIKWAAKVRDPLPLTLRESAEVMDLSIALRQAHYPESWSKLKLAQHRLAFDEIFLLQLGVLQQKKAWQDRKAQAYEISDDTFRTIIEGLPFKLTGAQEQSLADMRADLASGHPMNRLIQGDVGSGKTVVAALAAAILSQNGAQSAIMAPTSILAEQHYQTFLSLLAKENSGLAAEEIRLMIGATSESEKEEIRAGLSAGEIKIVIGTHAIIEDPVTFDNLQLAVIDEQHRFGVNQRAALRAKGDNPHILVMTATPIPRSLALTVYGDLDLTVIDEMPPGRQSVDTAVRYPQERELAYNLIRRQVEAGHQAFIIYPLVEESEKSEEKAAVEEYARLQKEIFPHFSLGLLHGRLSPSDKEATMKKFQTGEFDVLVSTSVVEVGVDVPNATVMLIEGAHRFGLAQLHQFRGRVGRGDAKSYCILIPGKRDAVENQRLKAMVETNDGFVLAERDLDQRGPGQFLGTRQSGFSELQMASITDLPLIEKARRHAKAIHHRDPTLALSEHQLLGNSLDRFWQVNSSDIS
ncbi:MAG: ATP-dependent DNA helicase RecG [Chloroflexota bacterium]